jgi:hypothetical protein
MTTRIREQIERIEDLKTKALLSISLVPVEFKVPDANASLEEKVEALAGCVTEMIMNDIHGNPAQETPRSK